MFLLLRNDRPILNCYYKLWVDLGYACWSYTAISALSLDHDFHKEVKVGLNCCQFHYRFSCRGHPALAKYHTVWRTFSRYYLLNAFSLTCTIQIVSAFAKNYGSFLVNYVYSPQQLDCGENWTYAYRCTGFPRTTILPI